MSTPSAVNSCENHTNQDQAQQSLAKFLAAAAKYHDVSSFTHPNQVNENLMNLRTTFHCQCGSVTVRH